MTGRKCVYCPVAGRKTVSSTVTIAGRDSLVAFGGVHGWRSVCISMDG